MRHFFIVLTSFLISYVTLAQPPAGAGNRNGNGRTQMTGSFYGKLIEASTAKPIEYASVQLVQNKLDSATKKRKEVVIA